MWDLRSVMLSGDGGLRIDLPGVVRYQLQDDGWDGFLLLYRSSNYIRGVCYGVWKRHYVEYGKEYHKRRTLLGSIGKRIVIMYSISSHILVLEEV